MKTIIEEYASMVVLLLLGVGFVQGIYKALELLIR